MGLLFRLNLALIVVFALGATIAGPSCLAVLQRNAEHHVHAEAELMIDSALAARDYTANEVAPLLHQQMQTQFLPQSIPFYTATEQFLRLHTSHPDYAYREATLNPTNPRDRATDWQAAIIERFRIDPKVRVSGERDTPLGPLRGLPSAAGLLDAGALLRLETELARFIGPVARHLVNRAAVRCAGVEELLAHLGRELASESERRAFISTARQSLRARS